MRRFAFRVFASTVAISVAAPGVAQVSVPLPRRGQGAAMPATPPAATPARPLPATGPAGESAAPSVAVPLPGAPPQVVTEPPANINPYDRDIDLTAPLLYRDRPLGEVNVVLTRDDRFIVEAASFLKLIEPLLNGTAKAKLAGLLDGKQMFSNADIAGTGVELQYDPGSLSVVVLRINADERAMEPLFKTPRPEEEVPDVPPATFSGYMNFNVVNRYFWGNSSVQGLRKPSIYLNGALRYDRFVLESDLELTENTGGSTGYRFDRNYVRLVYDEPEEYRRWFAGDLQVETRGRQSYVQLGGAGVSRQRRRFDPFRPAILQGNRQLVIQRDATVDVYRNGTLLKQFQLQAGAYDLSSMPLLTGSNDLEVRVRDVSGFQQSIAYRSYLDPIDLAPGDYEFAAYAGKISREFGRSPVYNGPLAFTGFFRKAFIDAPAIGVGLQLSRNAQIVSGQTQFVLDGGSRLSFDLSASRARGYGFGYAPGITFDHIFERNGLTDSLTLHAEHTSRRFASLATDNPDNGSKLSLDAQYARAISRTVTMLVGGTYSMNRGGFGNTYRINALGSYRIDRRWSVRAGVDYSDYGRGFRSNRGFGFNISLVFEPSYADRAEALYESQRNAAQVSYVHTADGSIGSVGYGGIVARERGQSTVQGFGDYIDSWFDASVSHSAFGNGFSNITDQQLTSLRVGTSLAFADGHFGVGRRINDSFAILYPHKTLKGHAVVAGQSLAENLYLSKSGVLGGAVNGFLSSYVTQTVQYDVERPPPGYDIGTGVVRVKPTYRSGYALEIGTDAFVSAMGTLMGRDGKPVSLAGGRVIGRDGKDAEPIPFFTNSAGRFAIQNLRPGVSYRVELFNAPGGLEFTVPSDTTGLVDLKTVVAGPAR